jgi:hypothetical protein
MALMVRDRAASPTVLERSRRAEPLRRRVQALALRHALCKSGTAIVAVDHCHNC